MYVTVLDTNVLRGLPPDEFSKLEAAELRNGVRQYADLWTLMELIAHLRSPTDADYRSCRMALRRCANRALLPADQAPRMLAPSELQISRLVFGEPLRDQEDNVAALVELARGIAMADDLGGGATVFNLWPIMSAKRSGGSLSTSRISGSRCTRRRNQ